MNSNKMMLGVLVHLQKKYKKTNEILDLTQEMDKALQIDDYVSFEMLLAMREDIMKQIDTINDTIKMVRNEATGESRETITRVLFSKGEDLESMSFANKEEKMMAEMIGKIRRTLARVIVLDKRLSIKIGGTGSYYKQS